MTAAAQVLDVPYNATSSDPLLRFDLHCVRGDAIQPRAGVLIFVHGGAWRSEDKADHAGIAQRLAEATRWPVLVPNYRLSGQARAEGTFRHPGHAEDILDFLEFLGDWELPSELKAKCDLGSIFLIGHSCSAHMLASIVLDSQHVTPSLSPPAQLLKAVKGIAISEGIYDLDLLSSTFPAYRAWFIEDAFGPRENYGPLNVNRYQLRPQGKDISWLILHSKTDALIDVPQSQNFYDHLCELYEGAAEGLVVRDFDRLKDGHDEIFRGDEYVKLIQEFVSRIHGSGPGV